MEKAELKKLLLEGTEKLIAQLSEILDKNGSLYNEMLILSKKYYEGKMEINLGTIKFEDWNILKTQVDVGLLDLIDRIQKPVVHEKKQNTKQKNIIVEDTIKWLMNALTGQGISSEEVEYRRLRVDYIGGWSKEKEITRSSWEVERVNIDGEGNFNITEIYKFEIDTYNSFEDDEDDDEDEYKLYSLYTSRKQSNIYGNFRDVNNVIIVVNENINYYPINLESAYGQKCFTEKIETKKEIRYFFKTKNETPEHEFEINNRSGFSFSVKDINLANSIKNAIDYLAIHFGRKEDAF